MNDVLATIISIGGWVGAAEFLFGYFLISRNRIAGDSLKYQALNITGSILLMTNCAYTGAWPSAISNVFYLFVGITILFTVKRAYIAQLARKRREEMAARRAAARSRRGAVATAELAELSLIEA
ncbi:hypothetical protein AXF14_08265 [Actinomyces radicidentis]|uniref:CBU-0592-like domain-containing protein n=1 Tax=Actinomyces radicidentis TaxID=111015 RepID=A0A0X8JEW9_ACTRD|nr:hypothetical protein [Actinomyces radicidentis]AMD87577.1 hypothetical protein AXF14_08265 [Actinomyces radicidentis]